MCPASINRRRFLQSTGALAAASTMCWSELPARASRSPNDKLNIALVGVAGRGRANTRGVSGENIAVLCDIDEQKLAQAQSQFPQAKAFVDWRKVMEDKTIDAVVISTADQVHAPASVMAMRMGKHVYCEKPLAHNVEEARIVRETFAKSKVATQMGTQIHAGENFRRVVEIVQSGAIGPVREAHVWCSRTINPLAKMTGMPPVPSHLQWDLWLGPAKYRPYHPDYLPGNLNWNRRWDFGNGVLGDMGSHLIDLPFWALNLKHPTHVSAKGPAVDPAANPPWMIVTWKHPRRKSLPATNVPTIVRWYHGRKYPKSPDGIDLTKWFNGIMFVGEKGKLVADYNKYVLLPKDKFAGFQPPPKSIPKSLGHYQEWIHAAKTGGTTLCNFEYSGALIEHNLLGNVAFRAAEDLDWDADNLRVLNCPDAEQYIGREYRKGWTI